MVNRSVSLQTKLPTTYADLKNHPRLLQQVRSHVGPDDVVASAEADLDIFSKATAVVVSGGFGVSNSLGNRAEGFLLRVQAKEINVALGN